MFKIKRLLLSLCFILFLFSYSSISFATDEFCFKGTRWGVLFDEENDVNEIKSEYKSKANMYYALGDYYEQKTLSLINAIEGNEKKILRCGLKKSCDYYQKASDWYKSSIGSKSPDIENKVRTICELSKVYDN